ncbi:hypothetical protein [Stenotrophomonas maltophilia]|uniref:hypothetical protein n=1 Tax=Stenotrophomonas maltophilia TaxID=40324 RepID=UPI0039C1EEB2
MSVLAGALLEPQQDQQHEFRVIAEPVSLQLSSTKAQHMMGIVIYNLALVFLIIPVTIRAYLSLKNGRLPLPHFQNNVVVSRIKLRKAVGILSPIIFWAFHVAWLLWCVSIDAWLGALATVTYMAFSAMLSGQIRAKQIGVIPEKAGDAAAEKNQG